MSNSALICYSKISPNRNSPRKGTIKGIAIHCMAGQLSVETCGNVFAPSSRGASSNYGIGPDGRIGMYVEERDRAWTTSTSLDNYCVTIEVASDPSSPYKVTDAAYESLIRLCADICKRERPEMREIAPGHSVRCHCLDKTAAYRGIIEAPQGKEA